jgi:poly(A) polymerase
MLHVASFLSQSSLQVMISVPSWPWKTVLRLAAERNVRVWLVGGAVRDILLHRSVHDWDFAVDRDALGLARSVANVLDGAYYPLDASRDTGRTLVGDPSGAHPVLDFAGLRGPDLRTDLSKRDFTINALAIDRDGVLLDPTGGLLDLEAGRLRAASQSAFSDDPLRLLRAIRVAGELHFAIEAETLASIRLQAPLLGQVSPERLRDELMRLVGLTCAGAALQRAGDLGLLTHVVPELTLLSGVLQSSPHRFDVWKHTLIVVDSVQNMMSVVQGRERSGELGDAPNAAWESLSTGLGPYADRLREHLSAGVGGGHDRASLLKLAALMHDVGKPGTREMDQDGAVHFHDHGPVGARIAAARLRALRFSGAASEHVRKVVGAHLRPAHLARCETVTRRAIYRYFRALGDAGIDVALLGLADHLATWGPNLRIDRWDRRLGVAVTLLSGYFETFDERVAPKSLLTGRDLLDELGLPPGPELGRMIEQIREAQIVGEVNTREEALVLARCIARTP